MNDTEKVEPWMCGQRNDGERTNGAAACGHTISTQLLLTLATCKCLNYFNSCAELLQPNQTHHRTWDSGSSLHWASAEEISKALSPEAASLEQFRNSSSRWLRNFAKSLYVCVRVLYFFIYFLFTYFLYLYLYFFIFFYLFIS